MNVSNNLKTALEPLLEDRQMLLNRRADIMAEREKVDQEIQTIDRVLRAGGLIERSQRAKSSKAPKYTISDKVLKEVDDWCQAQDKPFTKREMGKGTGRSNFVIHQAVMKLRGNTIRCLGRQGNALLFASMDYEEK